MTDIAATEPEGEPVPAPVGAPHGADYRPPVVEPLVQAAEVFPAPVVTEPEPPVVELQSEPETFHRGPDYRPEPEPETFQPVLTLESLAARVAALETK